MKMKRLNILFLNRSFYPDTGATGQLLTELCEDLSAIYNVTVIAGRPFLQSPSPFPFFIKKEKYKGVTILRTKNTNFPKDIFLGRIVNLLTFFIFSLLGIFFLKRQDVVIAETDPPNIGLVGWLYSFLFRCPFVYYCQDIYPDLGILNGKLKNSLIISLLEKINKFLYHKASMIIVLGKDMQERLIRKGVDPNKITIIENWVDCSLIHPVASDQNIFRKQNNLGGRFVVMFSGNLGLSQDLDKIIQVAERFKENQEILFVFIGDGANKKNLQEESFKLGLSNVKFFPYQPKELLCSSLSAADLHLITLQKGLWGCSVPSKIYGIMASGTPYVAAVDEESEVAAITKKYKSGICVEPSNEEELYKALEWCLKNRDVLEEMGKRGRKAAKEYFDRKIAVKKFDELLQLVTGGVNDKSEEVGLGVGRNKT